MSHKETFFDELVRTAELGLWDYDIATAVTTWNEQMYLLYGADPRSTESTRAIWIRATHPHDAEASGALWAEALQNHNEFDFEHRITTTTGEARVLHSYGRVIFDDELGAPVRIVGYTRNITKQKQQRDQSELNQRLDSATRVAGGIAHNFNNLLTAVFGYIDLIEDLYSPEPEDAELFAGLRGAAERAAGLTHELLTFTRRQVITPSSVDLTEVTRHAAGELWEDVRNIVSGEPMRVRADIAQLLQVSRELLRNAKESNGGDPAIVRTEIVVLTEALSHTHGEVPSGTYAVLHVEDHGEGMDEETAAHAFEPFFTTKSSAEHSGIGLSKVYGIVNQNGGAVTLETSPRAGCIVRVYWPLLDEDVRARKQTPPSLLTCSDARILYVEDDVLVRSALTTVLERAGFGVVAVPNGEEALEVFDAQPDAFDLILSDLMMPSMDGVTMFRNMRARDPDVFLIFATAVPSDTIHQLLDDDQSVDVLTKPFTPDALIQHLEGALAKKVANDSGSSALTPE